MPRSGLRTLAAARLHKGRTDAQCQQHGAKLLRIVESQQGRRYSSDEEAVIEAPFWRGGSPCFYDGRQPVVYSNLRVGGVPLATPIRSTHLEPGVTIICTTRAQFDAEARRHGYVRYDPRTGKPR